MKVELDNQLWLVDLQNKKKYNLFVQTSKGENIPIEEYSPKAVELFLSLMREKTDLKEAVLPSLFSFASYFLTSTASHVNMHQLFIFAEGLLYGFFLSELLRDENYSIVKQEFDLTDKEYALIQQNLSQDNLDFNDTPETEQ